MLKRSMPNRTGGAEVVWAANGAAPASAITLRRVMQRSLSGKQPEIGDIGEVLAVQRPDEGIVDDGTGRDS